MLDSLVTLENGSAMISTHDYRQIKALRRAGWKVTCITRPNDSAREFAASFIAANIIPANCVSYLS